MVYLTKKVHFSASHVLKNPELSAQENQRLFGKKTSPHGHNYALEITIRGEPSRETGFFLNFDRFAETIEEKILKQVNYKHLEADSSMMKGMNPTAENLVKIFWKTLETAFPKGALYEIKLQQMESETVTYRGEDESSQR